MKIVREHLNEIRQQIEGSGLGAIGVGKAGIVNRINSWFRNFEDWVGTPIKYTINDEMDVVLDNQTHYLRIYKALPPFINIKLKPNFTAFSIAVDHKDDKMINDLLKEYKKLNIVQPTEYKKIIKELENHDYICITTRLQFSHNTIAFIDLHKYKAFYVVFKRSGAELRRGEILHSPYFRSTPKLITRLEGVTINNYRPIIDYLLRYRSK